jgi:hypothetical protein
MPPLLTVVLVVLSDCVSVKIKFWRLAWVSGCGAGGQKQATSISRATKLRGIRV